MLSYYVKFLAFLLMSNLVSCLYSATDDVIELTGDNFKSEVLESSDVWFVEFYAPWCGHCKSLAPEWKKAATYLKGYVKVGAVDVTENDALGGDYGIKGFPTIKIFSVDKKNPIDYKGGKKAKDIVGSGFKEIKDVIRNRMGLKKSTKKKASSSEVVKLTAANFQKEVLESEDLWLVEFFAPWCGHCKNLAPHWKKAAAALKGKAKLGAVDATVHSDLAGQYDVKGYPTIKVFPKGKGTSAQDYQGGRTTETIVKYAMQLLGEGPAPSHDTDDTDDIDENSSVIKLDSSNFAENVLDSDDHWMVEFFAPWCGHCKKLAPEWKKAATELEGKVKLGAVDCTQEANLCSEQYGVTGYPKILCFWKGSKDSPEDYSGARDSSGIIAHATNHVGQEPIEILQLLNEDILKSACEEKTICLVAFLPHILDTGADGRNKYIEILKSVSERHRSLGYLWSEAFAQQKLEASVRVGGAGYPAAAIISMRKNRFVPFAGQFSEESLKEFITGVSVGNIVSIAPGGGFPTPVIVEEWDGKDGTLPVDEDDEAYNAKEEL